MGVQWRRSYQEYIEAICASSAPREGSNFPRLGETSPL